VNWCDFGEEAKGRTSRIRSRQKKLILTPLTPSYEHVVLPTAAGYSMWMRGIVRDNWIQVWRDGAMVDILKVLSNYCSARQTGSREAMKSF
jgi:hypothetical protein